jgi:S-formylglutathione hydrolase FrmB
LKNFKLKNIFEIKIIIINKTMMKNLITNNCMSMPLRIVLISLLIVLSSCVNNVTNDKQKNTLGHIGLNPLPVFDITFFSESLERDMHINVVLPANYEFSDIDYPVLYLCHGFTSNYHEFEYVGVPEYLNRFDMIVVMVDVGNSSYVNWARSDDGKSYKFADHVCIDIVNYIDKNYRTVADRKGRAINGISMGGFGAISLGLTHPELFCSIASHSGALTGAKSESERLKKGKKRKRGEFWEAMLKDTIMRYRDIDIEGFSTMKDRTPNGLAYAVAEDAERVDPFKLVLEIPKDQLPHIYLDCGIDDFLYGSSTEFMKLLLENKIPFQYGQSDGIHEEDYWGRELSVSMAVQYAIMLRNISGKKFERYDSWER